ncbi:MAG: hypothetical protein AB7F67_19035, partial [Rhodospirillaceae bacterium]
LVIGKIQNRDAKADAEHPRAGGERPAQPLDDRSLQIKCRMTGFIRDWHHDDTPNLNSIQIDFTKSGRQRQMPSSSSAHQSKTLLIFDPAGLLVQAGRPRAMLWPILVKVNSGLGPFQTKQTLSLLLFFLN